MEDLQKALTDLKQFAKADLTQRIADLEYLLMNRELTVIKQQLDKEKISEPLLKSSLLIKKMSSQIDVIVHAVGIMVSLPYLLEEGEIVQSLSLGAGNTGKSFDLETDRRIAEFKFISWKGGPESIRQNGLFKDFFSLVISEKDKDKYIYLTGKEIPIKFFNSRRSLSSILSKNDATKELFYKTYGDKYKVVSEYYNDVKDAVNIVDLNSLVPAFWNIE